MPGSMFTQRMISALQIVVRAAACGTALYVLAACPNGDVGAPCNHGPGDPTSKLVTFPALSCNDLLCVYGEDPAIPPGSCTTDAECNMAAVGDDKFACVDNTCKLDLRYVLRRSMCSKRCDSDDDCKNTGIILATKPVAEKNNCERGFRCARLQELGEFCCEKLCVCDDDLGNTAELDASCGTAVNGVYAACNRDDDDF